MRALPPDGSTPAIKAPITTASAKKRSMKPPARLNQLAHNQNLVTPKSNQVFHLEGDRPGAAVAMVKKQ